MKYWQKGFVATAMVLLLLVVGLMCSCTNLGKKAEVAVNTEAVLKEREGDSISKSSTHSISQKETESQKAGALAMETEVEMETESEMDEKVTTEKTEETEALGDTSEAKAQAEAQAQVEAQAAAQAQAEAQAAAQAQAEAQAAAQAQAEAQAAAQAQAEAQAAAQAQTQAHGGNPAFDGRVVVCLDPGHGGKDSGCSSPYIPTLEKDLNLAIALKIRDILQANGVTVVMTRDSDVAIGSLSERVDIGYNNGADLFVSIHNNSSTTGDPNHNGCLAISTVSHFQAENAIATDHYQNSYDLATSILNQLVAIGIPYTTDWQANEHNGIFQRNCTTGDVYPDGSAMDYYGIMIRAKELGIPATIVEHAFLSNYEDCVNHFSSDEQLQAMAGADAQGILNYIGQMTVR